jgi:CRP-like cAMP-binding protein
LPLGQSVYESGVQIDNVLFPTTAIVSLLYVMADGASAEIAVVGKEGLVGVALFMGGESTPSRAVVQSAGWAYRLKGQFLNQEFSRGGNRHHSIDQQLSRWLLLSLDRLEVDELKMTQELIANMLGVRREGVTEAAGKLQKAKLIRYSRGHIKVLDRAGLEARCCECYGVVKREYARLLPKADMTPGRP